MSSGIDTKFKGSKFVDTQLGKDVIKLVIVSGRDLNRVVVEEIQAFGEIYYLVHVGNKESEPDILVYNSEYKRMVKPAALRVVFAEPNFIVCTYFSRERNKYVKAIFNPYNNSMSKEYDSIGEYVNGYIRVSNGADITEKCSILDVDFNEVVGNNCSYIKYTSYGNFIFYKDKRKYHFDTSNREIIEMDKLNN